MKNTRKLIPALAMLLVSAVMVSTASFAWFSMNTTVTANGMSVKAEVNETFLLISNTPFNSQDTTNTTHAAQIQAGKAVLIELEEATANAIFPAEMADGSTNNGNLSFQYYQGTDFNDGTKTGNAQNVAKSASYVKEYVYYITVAKNSPATQNIVVSNVSITGAEGSEAAAVVVATDYACIDFKETTATQSAVISGDLTITDQNVFEVHVYVYIDGNHESITTANAANLKDAKVNIQFSVKKEVANP